MKKLTLILSIFLVAAIYSSTDVHAQNTTPSSEEVLNQNNTTINENVSQGLNSSEERKINIIVEDPN